MALDARKLTKTDSGIGYYRLNLARVLLGEDKDLGVSCSSVTLPASWPGSTTPGLQR